MADDYDFINSDDLEIRESAENVDLFLFQRDFLTRFHRNWLKLDNQPFLYIVL